MNRKFERKAKLPAFLCDLSTFENFILEMVQEFPSGSPRISISVSNPGEELSFSSIDEIRAYGKLPATVHNLNVHIGDYFNDDGRVVSLISGSDKAYARADGPSEVWCAGVVEKAKVFARNSRTWYWFIHPALIWALSIVAFNFMVQIVLNQKKYAYPMASIITLTIFSGITGYLFFCYGRVFRPISIVINSKDSWTKKYATELMIGAAIVSAIAALYTAIKGK